METAPNSTRDEIVAALRQQLWRTAGHDLAHRSDVASTGCAEFDQLLPRRGIRRAALVEWLGERGQGAGTLALLVARQLTAAGGALVVIDRQGRFYPPAAAAWGIAAEDLLIVRPASRRDELWAFEQALRCGAVAAVWGTLDPIAERAFRRLQLAAEAGGSVGLLVRPLQRLNEPTWADVSLRVQPFPAAEAAARRFRVEVVRCRAGVAGGFGVFEGEETTGRIRGVEPSDEAHAVPLVSQLVCAARPRRNTGT